MFLTLKHLRVVPFLLLAMVVSAATLQQLSMDQMTQMATSVVRARVIAASPRIESVSGTPTIYTHYKLAVSETWKGSAATEIVLPGGDVNGQKQTFPGVPTLNLGNEYLLFIWKSPSTGMLHALGLTQGIFDVAEQADGSFAASRRQSGELMVDSNGHRVSDQSVNMKLTEMKARVRQSVGVAQ